MGEARMRMSMTMRMNGWAGKFGSGLPKCRHETIKNPNEFEKIKVNQAKSRIKK